jgi:hypothetical protein
MRLRLKYLGTAFPIVASVLSFFFDFSLPKDWGAAQKFIPPVESWWTSHAAHPVLSAFFVGLSFGVVFLPEIWRVVRDQEFPSDPRPDWDLRDAYEYMRVRSKWAIGRVYYNDGRPDHLLEEDIDEAMRDAAVQGRISIWGRPTQTGTAALFSRGVEIQIPVNELPEMSIDLTTVDDVTAPNGAVFRLQSEDQYRFLRVNRRQIRREWPAASYLRRMFDRTWKTRRQRIVPDIAQHIEVA